MEINTIGSRIKWARKILGLTREYICEKYNVSINTLGAWERSESNLTNNAINTCLNILRSEGLLITKEWLESGHGKNPNTSHANQVYQTKTDLNINEKLDPFLTFELEKEFFLKCNHNSIVIKNLGNEMSPFYHPDEFIGGVMKNVSEINNFNGFDCIVQIINFSKPLFKRLIINSENEINLHILNPYCDIKPPIIYDVKLAWFAPVIWRRKLES
jgi:transcriptional regulator with XRE-family HTH domain